MLSEWQMKSLLHREMQSRARNDNEFRKWKARKDAQEASERLRVEQLRREERVRASTSVNSAAAHEVAQAVYNLRRPVFEV